MNKEDTKCYVLYELNHGKKYDWEKLEENTIVGKNYNLLLFF